jgi:protein-disulfide isomerase
MRVTGTPALLLEGGEMVPGYVPADKLRKALDARRAESGG